ncbi:hypothetical protein FQA39_LY10816 [Lamprigera yunnana]|nr:hypothetical protein FQA39_LY10816 [Lamprigera yunnana]
MTRNTLRSIYRRIRNHPSLRGVKSDEPYEPVKHHWFYKTEVDGQKLWKPFSNLDSLALETSYLTTSIGIEKIVSTDGGRFEVNLSFRERRPIYWIATISEIRRCSWFYKTNFSSHFIPFDEDVAEILENEFQRGYETNVWHRTINLPNDDIVAFNTPEDMMLLPSVSRHHHQEKRVKRGIDSKFELPPDESEEVDHLMFAVHGIGSTCDLNLRSIEEVVNILRNRLHSVVQVCNSVDSRMRTRVEVLPVNWHNTLHNKNSKTDKNLRGLTLETLPLLRNFINDTLVDILFYSSSIYNHVIVTTVVNEMNRIYEIFKRRNPTFHGEVSILGHSLGSVIAFDMLCHQALEFYPDHELDPEEENKLPKVQCNTYENRINLFSNEKTKNTIDCPQLNFHPLAFFAIGSPIGLFLTVRGIDKLGTELYFPTCENFFNIFHPCDPIAYRIEPLINEEFENVKPVLIPNKDFKYLHLKLKGAVMKVSDDVTEKITSFFNPSCLAFLRSIYLSLNNVSYGARQMSFNTVKSVNKLDESLLGGYNPGNLNRGRRVDYVLQGSTIEYINEYVCALSSHACYWDSTDVVELIVEELYSYTE